MARRLGPRVRLLGHSFGGLVARAAVIAEPALVESLVLLSSGPAALDGTRRVTMDQLEPVLAAAGLPGVYAAMQAAALDDPGFVAPARSSPTSWSDGSSAARRTCCRAWATRCAPSPTASPSCAATGVPVLVVHGVDDDAWPPAVQRDMAERLGARYAVIPDAAHSPAVENPAGAVSRAARFLGRLSSPLRSAC